MKRNLKPSPDSGLPERRDVNANSHLLGNHLFINAKALIFAGLFFEGKEAEQWIKTGVQILNRQVPEQILRDGGQFERTPMYHALALEDLLDLFNITASFQQLTSGDSLQSEPNKLRDVRESWSPIIQKMFRWLTMMSHPDGEISFFNDAAFGIAPSNDELVRYGCELGIPLGFIAESDNVPARASAPSSFRPYAGSSGSASVSGGLRSPASRESVELIDQPIHPSHVCVTASGRDQVSVREIQADRVVCMQTLQESGYIKLCTADVSLILDVAPIGPDYLPGHAHADTLSFEMSAFGQRLFVNSGTSCYGVSQERSRQRSTAAHNTVCIDDQDSSEVWGGFRVARRAYPFGLRYEANEQQAVVECSHDGYRRLKGKPLHRRRWTLSRDSLAITDTLEGSFESAVGYLHLHPDVLMPPAVWMTPWRQQP